MQKCIPADMGIQAHRPRDPRRGIRGQIRLHSHTLTQMHKRNKVTFMHRISVGFTETQAYRQRQRNNGLTPMQTHKGIDTKAGIGTSIQIYTREHIPRECTNGHGDPQIYRTNTEAHRDTSMHVFHTDRKVCTHTGRARHAFTNTVAQTRVCIVICMYANRSGHRYHRGIHKPRGAETQQNTQGKFPNTESSNAHSNINTCPWTHRCIHPESRPKTLVLMQTDLCRLTHTHMHPQT